MLHRYFCLFLVLATYISNAQNAPFEVAYNSPVYLKQKARGAEREHDYLLAMTYYDKLKELRPENESYWQKHGYYSLINKDYATAETSFTHLYDLGNTNYEVVYYLSKTKKHLGKYDEAIDLLEALKKDLRKTKEYSEVRKMLSTELEGCYLAKRIERTESKFTVKGLSREVNSRQFEGSPVWINEDQFIYASHKNLELALFDKDGDLEIPDRAMFSAKRSGEDWTSSNKNFTAPYIKGQGNFGNAAFNAARDKFFFSLCQKNEKFQIECKLYWSLKENGKWSEPKMIEGDVNLPGYTSTQPTMGYESQRNREVLYFVSDRPGGKGGMDIWYSILSDRKNKFGSVGNAGSKINTEGNEMTPYYTLPDSILYFSSDGHPGLGGLDIFKTSGERVKWDEPENIGKPFNSSADDLYFQPKKGKEEGLLVSNRIGSTPLYGATCCDDIFYYKFEKPLKLFAEIELRDRATNQCLNGEEIQMFVHDRYTDDRFLINQMNASECVIRVPLNPDLTYSFKGNIEGYQSDDVIIKTQNLTESNTLRDTIYVEPVIPEEKKDLFAEGVNQTQYQEQKKKYKRTGESGPITEFPDEKIFGGLNEAFFGNVVLKDLYYEFDSDRLTPRSIASIEEFLIPFLQAFPDIIVSLEAHTDHVGPETYNLVLSQRRAESVVRYLISRGINSERLEPRGFGESKPIAPNLNPDGSDNPEGRALNRRTELRVLGHLVE